MQDGPLVTCWSTSREVQRIFKQILENSHVHGHVERQSMSLLFLLAGHAGSASAALLGWLREVTLAA